jgi:hypothetical protein
MVKTIKLLNNITGEGSEFIIRERKFLHFDLLDGAVI